MCQPDFGNGLVEVTVLGIEDWLLRTTSVQGTGMRGWKAKNLEKRVRNNVGGRVKRPTRKTDEWATQIRHRIYRPGHP